MWASDKSFKGYTSWFCFSVLNSASGENKIFIVKRSCLVLRQAIFEYFLHLNLDFRRHAKNQKSFGAMPQTLDCMLYCQKMWMPDWEWGGGRSASKKPSQTPQPMPSLSQSYPVNFLVGWDAKRLYWSHSKCQEGPSQKIKELVYEDGRTLAPMYFGWAVHVFE